MSGIELMSYINTSINNILVLYPQSFNSTSVISSLYSYFNLEKVNIGICCKNMESIKYNLRDIIKDDHIFTYEVNTKSRYYDYLIVESLHEYENKNLKFNTKKIIFIETFGNLKLEWKDKYVILKFKLCDLGSHIKYQIHTVLDKEDILQGILNCILYNPTYCHHIFTANSSTFNYIKESFESVNISLDGKDLVSMTDGIQITRKQVKYLHITNILNPKDMMVLISNVYSNMASYEDILCFNVFLYVSPEEKELYESFNKEYGHCSKIFDELYNSALYIQLINDKLVV